MTDTVNHQVLLVEKPTGKVGPEHFKLSKGQIPEPKDGEALLRVRYISLDAANRAWMHGATYRAAVEANTVMAGGGIAEVVSSKSPALKPGDIVFGDTGWQNYAAVPAKHLNKMPSMEPMTHLLSVCGIAGLTAYFGLLDVGKPKAGETVVVSAAAGSVGSIVGQIAKIKGCRVVGIAGGKDKCDWLTKELGFDAAVDYKEIQEVGAQGFGSEHVQRGERLVHQQQLRMHDQRASKADPLTHPARQLAWIRRLEAIEPDQVDRAQRAATDLLSRQALRLEPQRHVLEHREPGKDREALEHHRNALRGAVDGRASKRQPAGTRLIEPRDEPQQRGLARPRTAEQADDLPLVHREIHAIEHEKLAAIRLRESLAYRANVQQ